MLTIIYDVRKSKKNSNFFYVFADIVLILLAGLRFRVGGDSLEYENVFYNLPDFEYIFNVGLSGLEYQPLWYVFNAIIKYFSNFFVSFQLIHAIIVNTSFFIIISKYCKHRFTAVTLYYILIFPYFNMEILRESLAVIIFLFAYKYLYNKKYIRYYLLVFLSYLFHASAIFLFILPFLVYFLENKISLSKLFIISSIAFLSSYSVSLIGNILDFNEFIASRYEKYTSLEVSVNEIIKGIYNLTILLGVMLVLKSAKLDSKHNNIIFNIYFLITALSMNIIGTYRLLNYFSIFYIFIIVDLIYEYKFSSLKIKTIIVCILFSIIIDKIYYYSRDMSEYNNGNVAYAYHRFIPYRSIFNPQIDLRRERIFYNELDTQ